MRPVDACWTFDSTIDVMLSSINRTIIVEKPLMPPPWPTCRRPNVCGDGSGAAQP